jgi:hypothetical protein
MIILALALVAGILTFYWYTKSVQIELDSATLCPTTGPLGRTIVLIDASDPLTAEQQAHLARLLSDFRNPQTSREAMSARGLPGGARYIEPHEQLLVYVLGQNFNELTPLVSPVCNPGSNPNEWKFSDELTQGRAFAIQRWQQFETKVDSAIPKEVLSTSQRTSPILETIAMVVEKSAPSAAVRASGQGGPTRLFIVSDMLQNSDGLSHFKGQLPNWDQFSRLSHFGEMSTDLVNVGISIIYLQRDKYAKFQTPQHYHWWIDMLGRMGAVVVSDDPV